MHNGTEGFLNITLEIGQFNLFLSPITVTLKEISCVLVCEIQLELCTHMLRHN